MKAEQEYSPVIITFEDRKENELMLRVLDKVTSGKAHMLTDIERTFAIRLYNEMTTGRLP
jgi:hypothetical protein